MDGLVQPFGEPIPYNDNSSGVWKHSGIIEIFIAADVASQLDSAKLVIFMDSRDVTGGKTYPVKPIFPSMESDETAMKFTKISQ